MAKDLGKDINKSFKIIDDLLECLEKFHKVPLKQGLKSKKLIDEDLEKVIDTAKKDAFSLSIAIEQIKDRVIGAKPKGNARFASQRVIEKFLSL